MNDDLQIIYDLSMMYRFKDLENYSNDELIYI